MISIIHMDGIGIRIYRRLEKGACRNNCRHLFMIGDKCVKCTWISAYIFKIKYSKAFRCAKIRREVNLKRAFERVNNFG